MPSKKMTCISTATPGVRKALNQLMKDVLIASNPFAKGWTCKKQRNGLLRYQIEDCSLFDPEEVRENIQKEINQNNQIILMEGKKYFTVMNPPTI